MLEEGSGVKHKTSSTKYPADSSSLSPWGKIIPRIKYGVRLSLNNSLTAVLDDPLYWIGQSVTYGSKTDYGDYVMMWSAVTDIVWCTNLFKDLTSINHTATNDWRWRILNWKLCRRKRWWNNFKALCLSWKFLGWIGENYNQYQSGMPMSQPRFDLGNCWIYLQVTGVLYAQPCSVGTDIKCANCLRVGSSKIWGNFIPSSDKITTQQDSYQHSTAYIHTKHVC